MEKEIIPGVYHWQDFHEEIGDVVHSYYVEALGESYLIDPRIPSGGLDWLRNREAVPRHIYLTNRLHYRHSGSFVAEFGTEVWCHHTGLDHFPGEWGVHGFDDGTILPGQLRVRNIDTLCPDESLFIIPGAGGTLSIGDALIRNEEGDLSFVADTLMGEHPYEVRRGLVGEFFRCMDLDFDHLLLAHGEPWVGGAKKALRRFVEEEAAKLGVRLAI